MIIWTKEMLKELKETTDLKSFCEKYSMSLPTARNKKKEMDKISHAKVTEALKEVRASKLDIIPSVILDIDKLIKEGHNFYIANCNNEIKRLENMIMDFEHYLEAHDLSDDELIRVSKSIAECRRIRRQYKNEKTFLDSNKLECENFVKFVKNLKEFSKSVEHCVYKPRILKDFLGETVKPTSTAVSQIMSQEVMDRLYSLEKFNLKEARKKQRERGEQPDIDLLKQNYQDLFKKLDKDTQIGILNECENMYRGVDIPQIKEYIIMNSVLPHLLVQKGYFLIGE